MHRRSMNAFATLLKLQSVHYGHIPISHKAASPSTSNKERALVRAFGDNKHRQFTFNCTAATLQPCSSFMLIGCILLRETSFIASWPPRKQTYVKVSEVSKCLCGVFLEHGPSFFLPHWSVLRNKFHTSTQNKILYCMIIKLSLNGSSGIKVLIFFNFAKQLDCTSVLPTSNLRNFQSG